MVRRLRIEIDVYASVPENDPEQWQASERKLVTLYEAFSAAVFPLGDQSFLGDVVRVEIDLDGRYDLLGEDCRLLLAEVDRLRAENAAQATIITEQHSKLWLVGLDKDEESQPVEQSVANLRQLLAASEPAREEG